MGCWVFLKTTIRSIFGLELQKVLNETTEEIMKGDTTPELLKHLKDMVDGAITDFKLDEEMAQFVSGPLYNRAAGQISGATPGGIPSKEEVATLASLRELLKINEEDTYDVHVVAFGEAYKKGVKEALGTTGVIREEFREPLDELRSRLGVPKDRARTIYLDAIGERMKPMVEFISNEMERSALTQEQLAQKKGKDSGEEFFKGGGKAAAMSAFKLLTLLLKHLGSLPATR